MKGILINEAEQKVYRFISMIENEENNFNQKLHHNLNFSACKVQKSI
jgi:hypothetical protein